MRTSSQIALYVSAFGMILSGLGTMVGAIEVGELIALELLFAFSIYTLAD